MSRLRIYIIYMARPISGMLESRTCNSRLPQGFAFRNTTCLPTKNYAMSAKLAQWLHSVGC